jgi:tryptophan synthase alpha chain
MGRLERCFQALRARSEPALIPFVTAGDPDLETTRRLLYALRDAGADAIEIGVPFSDPMAEGPTIQRSSERALEQRTSLRRVLAMVREVRGDFDLPLILMGYANNFLAMGEAGFADAAVEVGVDGVIIVDLPPEEGDEFYPALRERGIDPILLAAPTTTPERTRMLARETRGFLYYVSLTGVTGARNSVAEGVEAAVRAIQAISDIPVCVGFGVSTPEQAERVGEFADGVVVGSALVDRIDRAGSADEAVEAAAGFVAELKAPLRRGRRRRQ